MKVERGRRAFTLLEMLIAIGILGLIASVVIPAARSTELYSLEATAEVLAGDLRLARSLAVQYNTTWRVDFDASQQAWELVHTGSGNLPLPVNPLAALNAPTNKYRVELKTLIPGYSADHSVRLAGATISTSGSRVASVTFGPAGGTGPARMEDTIVWLTMGSGADRRFVRLTISWVTGQVWLESPQQTGGGGGSPPA